MLKQHLNFLCILLLSSSVNSLNFGLMRSRLRSHLSQGNLASLLEQIKSGQEEGGQVGEKGSGDVFENGVHDAENVFHLLKDLPHDCFTYEDDKYKYEYCHMESARQMGLQVQNNLREEYDLGRFSPQNSIQKYSPLLRLAKISLLGGDGCNVEGAMVDRKTKVKFFCAEPNLSMHIVSAREKSICNYRILVHVPELCFK